MNLGVQRSAADRSPGASARAASLGTSSRGEAAMAATSSSSPPLLCYRKKKWCLVETNKKVKVVGCWLWLLIYLRLKGKGGFTGIWEDKTVRWDLGNTENGSERDDLADQSMRCGI